MTAMVFPGATAQIARDEGLRLKPYRDIKGKLTIGFGRNLDDVGITKAEANALLDNDVQRVREELMAALTWTMTLDVVRMAVLVNLGYNLGVAGLLAFRTFLNFVKLGQFDKAADDLLTTEAARELPSRYARLAEQMRTGAWV